MSRKKFFGSEKYSTSIINLRKKPLPGAYILGELACGNLDDRSDKSAVLIRK
jgi:hypothetical protein